MDKLWAPWRVKYVTELIGKTKGCVFCRMIKEKNDKKNLIFVRSELSFGVLNLFPYNNGHVLILPNRHVNDLSKLSEQEIMDLFCLLNYVKGLLQKTLKPAGYNVGINLGRAAGAGFPGHLHVHVVPRWKGDVNFMPVVAQTKVISQSLKVLHEKLAQQHVRESKKKS
ncbi:MAG: HIT domain-containing protein [Candidatus Omnitrophica bacterium]|nr:HIT domain-containing protein [Candidatus Omnitrophota bacterium]